MGQRTILDKDGLRTIDEPDGIEDGPVGSAVPERVTNEIAPVGSAEDLLAEFSDGDDEMLVHEQVVCGKQFYVRELDIMSLIDVETQRLTVEKGEIVRKPNREAKMGLALEFSSTLMRKNESGKYEPLFSIETAQAFLRKAKAKALINGLAAAIYTVNPELSPRKKVQAAQALK